MDDIDQAQNEIGAEESIVAAPPADEPNTSEDQVTDGEGEQAQIDETPAEETTEESERKPSRAERRIRDLNARVKQYEQSNQPFGQGTSPQFPQYEPGEEIQPEQLQQDVVQTAQAIADLTVQHRLAQQAATSNIERDIEVLPTKYPELNPDSPEYSPELEKAITEEFQEKAFRVVGYDRLGNPVHQLDPNVRLASVAERYASAVRAAAKRTSADMKNSVARTADETAVKPGVSGRQEKSAQDMTIEELEAKHGFVRR